MTDLQHVDHHRGYSRSPIWQAALCRWAEMIVAGRLTLRLPGGAERHFEGSAAGPSAIIELANARPVRRLLAGGSLGFARSYLDGDWSSPDLGAVLELAVANDAAWGGLLVGSGLRKLVAYVRHRLRANSRSGSRRNISYHYDLGNDFYSAWLDETMTYSSACFDSADQSLETAQRAKYHRIVRSLGIGPEDHVLEIGCGWGGFAEYAARETGCRVTGLTLSTEQAAYAQHRLQRMGLADRVEIRLEDYRDCRGQFTKIVSIEMFEAVGEENWPIFFDRVRRLLQPGGEAVIQTITIADDRFEHYRRNADFIQTYIFPGGMLPSVSAFGDAVQKAEMRVAGSFRFGRDYERTLLQWDKAFHKNWSRIAPLGFDERFRRMWHYYLQYCAVGFRTERLDVVQFHLKVG
ncbi:MULTISPECIES: SAM-dependent methyltransferase [Pseudorhizobium]|uniref:Cyclopropane-fatty-acyl-phospholipid synthase n=2 Tax=Pseudorhizobium TaxID=1903858 RepID=A0A7W9YZM8_9HYPH|nr:MULTISPECIES: cyclopropane-fatty-acyl-phospholipid synthase family protein [Pseudorhizobium]MBB6181320.1 cyclopropane-fatty-acyl-phospholipid synthase [Pseudorhizobium flavum]CAD6618314.1 class I SAM-dependent methyltransferase [Pseudorhizobium flavum]CAD7023798.1 class I SAM-dependent methyltransferase [Pseudorhizobium halotolerans]